MLKDKIIQRLSGVMPVLLKYRLLIFYIGAITYLELIYRLWSFKSISFDFAFPVIFAFSTGGLMFLLSGLFEEKINKIAAHCIVCFAGLVFALQTIYFRIFQTPMSIYSLGGAADAMQFADTIIAAFFKNLIAVILIFVPFAAMIVLSKRQLLKFSSIRIPNLYHILLFCTVSFIAAIGCVNLTGASAVSQKSLYYTTASSEITVTKLGLLTTMRLEGERMVVELLTNSSKEAAAAINISESSLANTAIQQEDTAALEPMFSNEPNIMDINFEELIQKETDQTVVDMHKYFAAVEPTKKNKYTGMFEGHNLILLTAEGFSSYAVDPVLTPTLYKMSTEGFIFKNFYNPLWGVSTSDGEYVACTGLIPKSGVWSFARSGSNLMPFVMGNQFKKLGYTTKAYHNHSYTYYKRHISHPNMGYEYKGLGNGLKVKKTWPESDLEMIEVTTEEYINSQPFHAYYMTVSGHMEYNFDGNYIAKKNKELVKDLPYAMQSKAYIACNMELEFALKTLVERLEAAGIADNTVIALSADHYPYGLPKENIDELAGHKVEDNFELYKSTLIIWKKGMDPVVIDKPCSSLDINPTLSNLFGLEYDSRLLMGRDILSDAAPLVIFSNLSWITDRASFNAKTNTVTYQAGYDKDEDYEKGVNGIVNGKFKYSAKILEKNYYSRLFAK